MSHELRTPLNVILGYSEMLLDPEQTSARETEIDLYRRIHENARTQLQLVNEALEMSRNDDEGTLTMRDEEIVPDTIVGELIQEGTLRNPDGQTRLVANVATDFGRFRGDPVKLRMILTNLLDNSIKFTKKGVIEVGARRDRDMISFWVRDTGIGIPEELRPELFRAFRKGNQSDQSGLGIGLYIVKRLVESFDGEIQLSSEPGEGSTFTVFFPDQGESTVHS